MPECREVFTEGDRDFIRRIAERSARENRLERAALGTRLEEARSEALLLAVMMEKRCGAVKVILFGSAATGRVTLNEKS
jgi:hypothetical protein